MERKAYNDCMKPFISGQHEDRKRDFCIGAKICSGKAPDEKEAERLCAEAALNPKPPRKTRGKCKIDISALAACIVKSLAEGTEGTEGGEITAAKLAPIISGCTGQKVEASTREKFIKQCFKENAVTGDIKEAQKLRSMCTARWKEQEAPVS